MSRSTSEVKRSPLQGARLRRWRRFARARRRWGFLLLAFPVLFVIGIDATIRGDRLLELPARYLVSYAFALAESALLWGLLLYAASARRGAFRWVAAFFFVGFATIALGVQVYFHRQYSTYINLDATLFGTSFSESLFGQLRADAHNFCVSLAPPLVLTIALVWLGRRVLRPTASRRIRIARILAPVAAIAVFLIPCSYQTVQASTPDVIYFHAIGGLVKSMALDSNRQVRPGLRSPPVLPKLAPASPPSGVLVPHRNVLFILTESVRADAHCSAPTPDCAISPAVNEAAPERIPLLQMRSNDSTTAISLAVLWSGLQPVSSRKALHSAPLLFDFAHAAGMDDAYWTSHHMLFANSRLWVQDLPTSHQVGATDIDPHADMDLGGKDELLTARIEQDFGELEEPFFAVAHFGNTHVPYRVDPNDSPFQPSEENKGPEANESYRNYYKNAVHLQDKTIGELIRFVRSSPVSERTVILFTSDHGEAFREHDQLGHTGSIYDEEIHVPFWIDAPEGALSTDEEASLRSLRDEPVFHTDLTPTMLDLLGLWDAPGVAPYRSAMIGSSLLRPRKDAPALALTNCSGVWGCAFKNWGMMRGSMKLEAREWDQRWHCFDVLADPSEKRDLGEGGCGDLEPLAKRFFGGMPSEKITDPNGGT